MLPFLSAGCGICYYLILLLSGNLL